MSVPLCRSVHRIEARALDRLKRRPLRPSGRDLAGPAIRPVRPRRVTCYYFYVVDAEFGAGFVKICSYFPYPVKVWVNGHEYAKRQATKTGFAFTALSNGLATCLDPAALQAICDSLGPRQIQAFCNRWLSQLPVPLGDADEVAGYWWEFPCVRSKSPAPSCSPPLVTRAASSKPVDAVNCRHMSSPAWKPGTPGSASHRRRCCPTRHCRPGLG